MVNLIYEMPILQKICRIGNNKLSSDTRIPKFSSEPH